MKTTKVWIKAIVLLLLIFTSCREESFVTNESPLDAHPVNIFGEIRQTPVTRVSDNGFADKDAIGIYVVNYNNETPGTLLLTGNQADNVKYVYDAATSKWVPNVDVYYKDKHTKADIIGYYPYTTPTSVDAFPFELAKDQSTSAANGVLGGYEASDFLWGKAAGIQPTAERVPITFAHKMAGVQVELTEGTGFNTGEWVNLNKEVLVLGVTRKTIINLATGTVTPQGAVETTGTIPYKSGAEFRAVVAPQTVQANISLFSITVDGTPYTFSKPDAFVYSSGKLHKFTINVSKKTGSGLQFTVTSESITAWENDKISHNAAAKEYVVVHCAEEGKLKEAVIASGKDYVKIKNLKVTGIINAADYEFMRDDMALLQAINLKDVESCKTILPDGRIHYSIPLAAFFAKSTLIHFVFPDKLTEIGSSSFSGTNLTGSLIIPEGVEIIRNNAFGHCSSLSGTLTLPSTLKSIEVAAFSGCSSIIGTLNIPESVEKIEGDAFSSCKGLTGSLILPEKLMYIGYRAFSGCSGLSGSLTIPLGIKELDIYTFSNCGFNGQLYLHKDITLIGEGAFKYCNFRGELVLPENLTVIGSGAFHNNQFSGNLVIPSSVAAIGGYAFAYNWRLSGVVEIPDGIVSIAEGLFRECSQIEGIVLPKSIETIGSNAFENCFQLNNIVSNAIYPPAVNAGAFDGVAKDNFTLEVPDAAVASYQTATGWKEFRRIAAYRNFSVSRNLFRTLNPSESKKVVIRALTGANWKMESKPDWVTVSPSSGTGKVEVTITTTQLPKGSATRSGEVVFKLDGEEYRTSTIVEQYNYEYADGSVLTLQKSTRGQGVNLVFMGDCFDAKDISEGKYLNGINEAMGYFFDVEPYKTYKDYFNVYAVFGQSADSGVGSVNTIREAKFGTSYFIDGLISSEETSFAYARKAPINNNVSNTLIVMVVNTEEYAGVTYMWGDGSAIALCPMSRDPYPYDFRGIVQHEAGGHGFGKLGDEYILVNAFIQTCPISGHHHIKEFEEAKSFGWHKNLSLSGNMYEVPWSHLIFHPTYSDKVDVYEGAYYHTRGVFRSEANSCMNNNIPYFNAISRQAIVEYIKKHAGETFTLADFYAKDVLDASSVTRSLTTIPSLRTRGDQHPPKYMGDKPNFKLSN